MIRSTILSALVLSGMAAGSRAGAAPAPQPTLTSLFSQVYTVGDPATLGAQMTIVDVAGGVVTAARDIRLVIPAGLNMIWDPSVTLPSLTGAAGSASGKVKPSVSYPLPNVMLIDVGIDFVAGDDLIIANHRFMTFSAASAAAKLGMSLDGDVLAEYQDAVTKAIGAPTISSAASQVFRTNDPLTGISQITITDDGTNPRIRASQGIKVRIPSTFAMAWDTADTTVSLGGTAMAKVNPTVSYPDSRTLLLTVITDFTVGQTLTLSNLSFTGFGLSASDNLELVVNGAWNTAADDDDKTIQVGNPPTLASAAGQAFTVGDPATPISVITLTDAALASVTATNDIRITIPAALNMTWDTADTTGVFGVTGVGAVSATVSYANLGKTLVIDVTTSFGPNAVLTIDGLSYANFTAGSAAGSLTLESDADASVDATDGTTRSIGAPTLLSGTDQVFVVGDPPTAMSPALVGDGLIPRITAANDIRIRIPAGVPMTWLTTDTTAVIAGGALGKVSTTVSYANGGKTLVLNVTGDFAAGENITVSGLSFANFTAPGGPVPLELEVNNLGTVADQDAVTVAVVPVPPPPPAPDPGGSTGNVNCGLLGAEVVVILALLRGGRRFLA